MPSFIEMQKAKIAASFNLDEGLNELTKSEIYNIEKGGKRAMIGEKRTFAGREYIKTSDGWKFHGKGTGSKAQSHVAGALDHHVGEKSSKEKPVEDFTNNKLENWYKNAKKDHNINGSAKATVKDGKIHINSTEDGKKYSWSMDLDPDEKSDYYYNVWMEQGPGEEQSSKSAHKDATDHFVEDNGKHYIDILDPDSGEKKFKPGDKVKYKDDSGKQHKGTISDREHEDGDMFEVDREEK